MLNIYYFHFNPFSVNTWLVWNDSKEAIIVDPGFCPGEEHEAFTSFISREGLKPEAVLITHGHIDHVLGVADCCRRYGIPAYMGSDEAPAMDQHWGAARRFGLEDAKEEFSAIPVTDGQVIRIAGTEWKAIATPGHSPGGICYLSEKENILFSGDTLFKETIGRTDLPLGNYDDLIVSIMDKLMGLDGEVNVLPGHGAPTTIADERTHNPFLQPWGEPDQEDIDWNEDGIILNG